MDGDDAFVLMMILLLIVFIGSVITFGADHVWNEPVAANEAQETCIERGYDNYDYYSRVPFTQRALGITCEFESKYLIDEDGNILVDARR